MATGAFAVGLQSWAFRLHMYIKGYVGVPTAIDCQAILGYIFNLGRIYFQVVFGLHGLPQDCMKIVSSTHLNTSLVKYRKEFIWTPCSGQRECDEGKTYSIRGYSYCDSY